MGAKTLHKKSCLGGEGDQKSPPIIRDMLPLFLPEISPRRTEKTCTATIAYKAHTKYPCAALVYVCQS